MMNNVQSGDDRMKQVEGVMFDKHRVLSYMMGGSAYFTIRNRLSGNRFTFHVKNKKGAPLFFVRVLTGPDNKTDYTYLGTIHGSMPNATPAPLYKHGIRSEIHKDAASAVAFSWLWWQLTNEQQKTKPFPLGFEFLNSGRCGRCARMLTTPESLDHGFGPECIEMIASGKW